MSTAQMKKQIIKELNSADDATVKDIYGVLKTIKQQHLSPSWKELSLQQKQKIETGLKQLKEGKGKDAMKVTETLVKKYGIKG
ncbi:MAG: hypothetical protein KGZ74_03415 [Chitinophagaceae bacterium]|nr:hypothetical protein [Chitinophagaceae bacterium]